MRRYRYLLLAGFFFLFGCNGFRSSKDAKKDAAQPPKDNYIVLLDLSNRILYDSQRQVSKDIEVIKSIYSVFKTNLDTKDTSHEYYSIGDKLKLLAAPHWYHASVDLSAEQPDKKAMAASEMEKTFTISLPGIYKEAVNNNGSAAYSGADIWKYFNEYITDDLDKDAQNTLFIITDGYMDLKKAEGRPPEKNRFASCSQIIDALKNYPDWETRFTKGDYGLLPVQKKFSNLQVIVLQVNPKEGWNEEYPLLTKIWSKWFTEMGISNYHLVKNDSAGAVKQMLAKLMNTNTGTATATKQLTAVSAKDSALHTLPLITKEPVIKKDSVTAKEPVAVKEKPAVISSPPVANTVVEKKPPVIPKRNIVSTPEVLPPDESDTRLLDTKKTGKPPAKSTASKDDSDILQDAGAANGFNTGIKKNNKKKNP